MTPTDLLSSQSRLAQRLVTPASADGPRARRQGRLLLTSAVRPARPGRRLPREAYRLGTYRDEASALRVPVLAAAVSADKLFDVFLDLMPPLGPVVDVVLETSHHTHSTRHRDLFRTEVDLPVLQSHLCDFEELLLHDGCTGVAVISGEGPVELQFDEHKQLVVYGPDLRPFQEVLRAAGVRRDDGLRLLSEAEHVHSTEPRFAERFAELCSRLGAG